LLATVVVGRVRVAFPVMIVLGPLIAAQYTYWRRRGLERTTWQYCVSRP